MTETDYKEARYRLSAFVRREATRTANELGFGWRPATVTPSGLDGLRSEFRSCRQTGLPFRVLREFSDDTIFVGQSTNWAMRFWHDTRHVWLGADFSTEAELQVAECHLRRARDEGFGYGSLEHQMLLADTVGQTLYVARTSRFVTHQLDFVLDFVTFGIDMATRLELKRGTQAPAELAG